MLETVTLTIVATVGPDAVPGSSIANTATVDTQGVDPDPTNNRWAAAVGVASEADLSVVKVGSPDPVVAGQTLAYTVTVTNDGPSDAQAVVVADTLPDGTTFLEAVPDSGSCSEAGGVITCTLGSLAAGDSVAILIDVLVGADVPAGSTLTNAASVASTTPDPDPGNDDASVDTEVTADADVAVTKTGSPDPFVPGEPITWTIEVTNAGPSDAVDLVVTDLAGGGLTIVDAPDGCEIGAGGATVTCEQGTLAAGESITLTVVTDTDTGLRRVENVVEVSSGTSDPVTANNRGGIEIDAVPPPIAFTGLSSTPMIVLAWLLMGAGAVLVVIGRWRDPLPGELRPAPARRRPQRRARWW